MLKKIVLASTIIVSFGLGGCASVPMASQQADATAKQFATDSAKANVYIYRNENFGGAIKMPVLMDNVSVGDTAAKTYILQTVEPGNHVITSKTENDATLSLDTQAGKNYYVWQEVKLGFVSARSALHLVDEKTGEAGVIECKLVK